MAIFVSELAFGQDALAGVAKVAVLIASVTAALVSLVYGRTVRLAAQD